VRKQHTLSQITHPLQHVWISIKVLINTGSMVAANRSLKYGDASTKCWENSRLAFNSRMQPHAFYFNPSTRMAIFFCRRGCNSHNAVTQNKDKGPLPFLHLQTSASMTNTINSLCSDLLLHIAIISIFFMFKRLLSSTINV
jgi:hypothetical protein